ncbi:MAG: hypothetical protein ACREUA_07535 [Burkholderiales bacterium]
METIMHKRLLLVLLILSAISACATSATLDERTELSMYAVIRETSYAPDKPIYESQEFREFQQAHAHLRGYTGTVVADVGSGRFLTLTLWETAEDMVSARETIGPVVQRLLDPLMAAPSKLLGTGPVVVNDLVHVQRLAK